MKQLIIIRHAKSDQGFWGNDFERPLNDRGKSDAMIMAKRLKEKQLNIDSWAASPAKRARKTAETFTETFNIAADNIVFISALYHAPAEVFYEVVAAFSDNFNTVALFSHNPGITYFVNSLVSDMKVDNMPTCAMFAVKANILHWCDFVSAKRDFLFFDYPKK